MRHLDTSILTWRGDELFRQGSRHPVLCIERDGTYPSMWRVRRPDGSLSDMANRTRAKDAALSIALRHLRGGETSSDRVYSAQSDPGVPELHGSPP